MDLVVPARVTAEQIERAQELAVRAFVATDCEGMARADLFVRADGEVLVNELNTIPGFTATSVYARLFEESGIPYAELLQRLADLAVERFERRSARCATDEPPGVLLVMRHPALLGGRRAGVRRAAGADPRGGDDRLRPRAAEVVVPAPPRSRAASCVHGSNEPAIEEFRTRQNLDAHQRAGRRGVRVRRRDLAALLRRRQPSGRAELHQLVRARTSRRSARTRAICSRSAPTRRRALVDGPGRSTCCRARRFAQTPESRELVSRAAGAPAGAADRSTPADFPFSSADTRATGAANRSQARSSLRIR